MSDGASVLHNPIVAFMVGCPAGVFFWDYIDMTDYKLSDESGVPLAYSRFTAAHHAAIEKELVKISGRAEVTNLLLMDGAMRRAGKMFMELCPSANFAVCFPHSIDKICHDLNSLAWMEEIITKTRKISNFIYAHEVSLALFRDQCGKLPTDSKNLKRPAGTRFAGEFYAMDSQQAHMQHLEQAVVTAKWASWSAAQTYREEADEVRALILDRRFHRQQAAVIKVMKPILYALRLGDGDSCSMGFVYPVMANLKDEIDAIVDTFEDADFPRKATRSAAINSIITSRWQYLHCPYHSAAYALNPCYLEEDLDDMDPEVREGLNEVVQRFYHDDPDKAAAALDEFEAYKEPGGPIRGNNFKLAAAKRLGRAADAYNYTDIKPWNFWKTHCAGLPLIRAVGITVLSKQAGIGANERAHKETKQVLTKARNRLETQRAARSVYIRHNRRLLDKLAVEMYTMDYDEPEDITTLTLEPEEVTATLEALALQGDPREQDGIDEPDESRTESAAPSRDDCLLDLGSLSGSDSDDSG